MFSRLREYLLFPNPGIYLALSFVFPFAILGTVFALHGVYPFGNRQILIHDFYHQFYPFLSGLWHKLREGAVSSWSWTAGMGHDYVLLIAYYMASPLNLPALIMPHAWLREILTLALLVKIGFAGLFTAMYLRYAYKQCGIAMPVFAALYALCAFTLGYYHNIIWFDSFALLPLVMLGLLALMREGKYRLYIVSLALAVLVNFYIGYMICVFVAITFFCLCVIQKLSPRDFLRKLRLVAACSALVAGLTAVLTIPAWSGLQKIHGAPDSSPTLSAYASFFDILGNFIAFTPPTSQEGLPNLYSGMISVLLAGIFIASPKVSLREKIMLTGTLVFLVLSCNLKALAYLMHGFRYPSGFPARFSFLISFVLVVMAYRAFILIKDIEGEEGKHGLLAIGISAALFLLSAVLGSQGKNCIIGNAVLCAFYILAYCFLMRMRTVKTRTTVKAVFFLVILTELSITSYIGIKTARTTNRDEYYNGYKQIQALLNKRQKTDIDFYRTEIPQANKTNEPYFDNYNGISFFSSTINFDVLKFTQGLGLYNDHSLYNSFHYIDATPLTNILLNLRYTINPDDLARDKNVYWKTVGKAGDSLLLENKYYLPLGFMVNEELAGYKRHDNLFLSQNNFFSLMTGLTDNLFEIFDISTLVENDNEWNILKWDYYVPITGMAYAYCESHTSSMGIYFDYKTAPFEFPMIYNMPFFITMGSLTEGDTVSFVSTIDKASIYVAHLNGELFERGYAKLSGQTLNLTKFTNTQVCGNVTALDNGLLYTSIPADKNWNVYVDGEKSEIVPIDGAMAAVRLNKGYHEIEFRYFNTSLLVGIIISLVSLGLFITILLRIHAFVVVIVPAGCR